jgi:hypothetical protein
MHLQHPHAVNRWIAHAFLIRGQHGLVGLRHGRRQDLQASIAREAARHVKNPHRAAARHAGNPDGLDVRSEIDFTRPFWTIILPSESPAVERIIRMQVAWLSQRSQRGGLK